MSVLTAPNVRLLAVLGIGLLGMYGAWRNRPKPGSTTLAAFMAAVALVSGAHLAAHLGPTGLQPAATKLRWIGLVSLPYLLATFALAYTGRSARLTARTLALLFAVPIGVAVFLWSPELAALAGRRLSEQPVLTFLAEEGPLYLLVMGLSFTVLVAAALLLVSYSFRVPRQFRSVLWAVSGGVVVLLGTAVIEVLGLFPAVHLHWIQNGFLVMGLAVLWAVYRGGLTELTPVAWPEIIRNLDVAVLVVDTADRITDANEAARELLADPGETLRGRDLAAALADEQALLDAIGEDSEGPVTVRTMGGDRHISPSVTPLTDARDNRLGSAILLYDVTTQQRQRDELERQNERLDQFASIVSHDLRNPLTVARGRLELATEECDSEHLESVARSHDRMETIIDRVLTFARTGDIADDTEPVRLKALVETVWDNVETTGATLSVETDATVIADTSYLQQLLENLIRNAIEHGAPEVAGDDASARDADGLTVTVGDMADGFYVADDGPGIDRDERERIFESGYTTNDGGPGLGLAIVAEIVDAHGWSVDVTESESGGARFEITGVERGDGVAAFE